MGIKMAWKKLSTFAATLVAVTVAGQTCTQAGDLLGVGCSTCQKNHAAPAYVPVPVAAYGYAAYSYGPRMAVTRQLPGQPPEPAPKWARPRGTVPVIALPEPAPQWANIDPAALAVNTPVYPAVVPGTQPYPTMVQSFASGQRLVQTPVRPGAAAIVPVQQGQPVGVQPLPNAVSGAPGTVVGPAAPVAGTPGAASGAAQPVPSIPSASAQLPPGQYVMTPQGPQRVGPAPGAAGPAAAPGPAVMAGPAPAAGAPVAAPGYPAAPAIPQVPLMTAPRTRRVQAFNDDSSKPPPGTLGRTYLRPARLVPWDKHPRTGMLDVEILDTLKQGLAHDVKIRVMAEDMYGNYKPLEGFRGADGVWHLESDHPLLPTVPHIYNVRVELFRPFIVDEFRHGRRFQRVLEKDLGTLAVRRVRLIPGRIVDLVVY